MEQVIAHLSSQRERLKERDQLEDPGRISAMVDVAVISLYNRVTNRLGMDPQEIRRSGAVLATGEFGRRHLGPYSPITLLLLQTPKTPFKEETWATGIVQPLQEAGWDVESQAATIEEAVELCLNVAGNTVKIIKLRFCDSTTSCHLSINIRN